MANFASDNTAPAHPAVLAAIAAANEGHAAAYGDDHWTTRAVERIHALFGAEVPTFLVWNGTGANVTGLSALLRPRDAVICTDDAHINVDEGGAPERFAGAKLIDLPTEDSKLRIPQLEPLLHALGVMHHVQPRVVSITQSTERGTLYSVAELRELTTWAHRHGLLVHMDGARIANATAALGGDIRATVRDVGIDVLSFGFTKNGGMGAEAVVFLDPRHAEGFEFTRKQGMQLASKMRFLAAQVDALLADGLWLRLAGHANQMARRLAAGVEKLPGVRLARPAEANAVFAHVPDARIKTLQERHQFYVWKPGTDGTSEVRWMCSWDTTEQDVDAFVRDIGEVCA
ncbi:MAG TPA: aminotransferase class I/II-fold pyridoxal phosphate-dependent enzyme [Gemmatimonadales bacterium]|nr:aminotransferase class I/II-fold pyridoxal phosphate-dependent enzyme [Gemmatimonadales bacterium]